MRMLIIAILVAGACGKNQEPPPPSSGVPNAKQESGPGNRRTNGGDAIPEQAQKMFMTVCATCHGMDGTGTGPAAETLTTKPRNYTDAAWQATVTDDELKKTIL